MNGNEQAQEQRNTPDNAGDRAQPLQDQAGMREQPSLTAGTGVQASIQTPLPTGNWQEPSEPPAVRMFPFAKLGAIITSPSKAAAAIRTKPDVLLPILLLVLTPIIPIAGNWQAYLDTLVETLAMTPQTSSMTADQLRQLAQMSAWSGLAFAPVTVLIFWLLGTLVLFAATRLLGGTCRYKELLSLKGYTAVFGLLSALLTLGVSLLTGGGFAQIPVTSLLTLFPDVPAGFLQGIAAGVEVFSLWSVVATGIGLSVISGISRKKAGWIVGVLFVLSLVIAGVSGQAGAAYGGLR